MTQEQILKLIDAGYTKADIDAMQPTAPVFTPPVQQATHQPIYQIPENQQATLPIMGMYDPRIAPSGSVAPTMTAINPQTTVQPVSVPTPQPQTDFSTMLEKYADLQTRYNALMVASSQQPPRESAEDILGTIINPTGGK